MIQKCKKILIKFKLLSDKYHCTAPKSGFKLTLPSKFILNLFILKRCPFLCFILVHRRIRHHFQNLESEMILTPMFHYKVQICTFFVQLECKFMFWSHFVTNRRDLDKFEGIIGQRAQHYEFNDQCKFVQCKLRRIRTRICGGTSA